MTDKGRRGVPVQAVIAALIAGKACEKQKENRGVSDGSVVVNIFKKSRTICGCAKHGMAWDDEGETMRLMMSVKSLVDLCDARGIDPADFKVGNWPRFQFLPNDKNPLGGMGVHVATVPKDDLASMISEIVSMKLGVKVTVTVEDLPQLGYVLDEAA